MGKYLLLLSVSVLLLTWTPWVPWWPSHDPPYTCQELLGMTAYAEWSHQYYATHGGERYGTPPQVEMRWVAYYQRIRPMIEAGCVDGPAAPTPAPAPPLDPVIEWPF